MTTQIIPHGKANGTDFCGTNSRSYIVRSDLGCYMKSGVEDLHEGSQKGDISALHPNCSGGDHYMAFTSVGLLIREMFIVIKGNDFRQVRDLTKDADAVTGTLHKKCQGGDFYLAAWRAVPYFNPISGPSYIIIFAKNWKYLVVSDLSTAKDAEEYELHDNCKGGLYYWADNSGRPKYYLVKPDQWGVQFHFTTDLHTDSNAGNMSFHPSVTNFLPGGMAVTMGPTFGVWQQIGFIGINSESAPVQYTRTVQKTIGYKKQALHSVQENWTVSTSFSTELSTGITIEKILEASCKQQFSYSTSYGGQVVDTTQEDWSEERTTTEEFSITLQPGECLHVWQYKLGFTENNRDVLHCNYLQFTGTPTQPTNIPLPSTSAGH